MTPDGRQRRKLALDRTIKACRRCVIPDRLNEPGVTESAPGFGSIDSPVVIVGQSLCTQCMKKQEPFFGRSGLILDAAFARAGLAKTELFVTNVVHCHPPRNRPSLPHEKENCRQYLLDELEIVRPRLAIGLGDDAHDALRAAYPGARELSWPFSVPRAATSTPDLLFPPHPGSFRWKPKDLREQAVEQYVADLAAALRWAFGKT